ncbi:type IV secretory system conjugative DNA transfer family protein [Oculatella sp. FACHB-28]|uniref:type IV secretory system conjugative DNA transfer family protein n=1 Tax=Oculatella sp. FACHB-28 TaxID=2692845 RepID=UPI001686FB44|nr:type IV secretory system conjugative DNA transfer family protein [Oculatella sp. FACHB-28]MBD2060603.1 type IV secretory system conjugative DNA transfer family protein [Oculatella sp. FACHB-28]
MPETEIMRASGSKASMNVSDHDRIRKLFSPDQFLHLGTGKCILINPGYASRDEFGIPALQRIKIPEQVRKLQDWSKTKWNEKVRSRLGVGVASA